MYERTFKYALLICTFLYLLFYSLSEFPSSLSVVKVVVSIFFLFLPLLGLFGSCCLSVLLLFCCDCLFSLGFLEVRSIIQL